MGRKAWREIRETASPEVRAAAERQTRAVLAAMQLDEIRKARGMTQEELAERLGRRQSNVSQFESRGDMHVSTLSEVVKALGGELELVAHFPDGDIQIAQFQADNERAGSTVGEKGA